ncbi:hypothetical protein BGM19_04790 [Streptomyces agglomeratus]|uniref:hypothetical protein n=1 Tax=Streptomyces agglomeratus TaxID=285458 RepID=UPI00085249E9|nr:hypothetical protein [Streptomyces agglomeratus]OEJ57388.1 hypothetical protein BGM19_04790 [Streptomyces agglomeratus]
MAEGNATLKSQYAEQVDADLERNTQEQERVRSEVAALQSRLEALEKDHELLVSMRAALGTPPAKKAKAAKAPKTAKAAATATVPRARRAAKEAPAAARRTRKTAEPDAPQKANKTTPPLRELVVGVLAKHDEPRSAAEVTQELAQAHPGRTLSVTMVRNALEASVAKNQSERTKQQKSVYYRVVKDAEATQEPSAATPAATAGV